MVFWSKKERSSKATVNEPAASAQRLEDRASVASAAVASKAVVNDAKTTGHTGASVIDETSRSKTAPAKSQPLSVDRHSDVNSQDLRFMATFGEIVSVLMRSPQFRGLPLGEIESLVLPALVANQFAVAQAKSKSSGRSTPVAAVLWAMVAENVDQRLSTQLNQPFRLTPQEWTGGSIPWLVVLAGDKRAINPLIKNVRETRIGGRYLKVRVKSKDGKAKIREIGKATGKS